MTPRKFAIISAFAATAALAGCAADNALQTASVADQKQAQAKVDPACIALAQQINTLRAEGSVERLEKAAEGKGKSVNVKRTSLATQVELNQANAQFQAKCGPNIPSATTVQVTPAAAPATQTAAAAPPQPQN